MTLTVTEIAYTIRDQLDRAKRVHPATLLPSECSHLNVQLYEIYVRKGVYLCYDCHSIFDPDNFQRESHVR